MKQRWGNCAKNCADQEASYNWRRHDKALHSGSSEGNFCKRADKQDECYFRMIQVVMKEEYLSAEPLATTTRGEDIFKILEAFLLKHELGWKALVGVCTDESPTTGCKSGFKAFVKNVALHISFIHCVIHRTNALVPGFKDGDTTFFTQMTTPLNSMPKTECSFLEETSAHLLAVSDTIESYLLGLDDRCTDPWIYRPFSVKESAIRETGVVAKVESNQIYEDDQLKVDFTEQELPTVWAKVQDDGPILSICSLTMLIQSPSIYRCEVEYSAMVALKTKSCNRLEIDADAAPCFDRLMAAKQFYPSH
ncbi:uncharacterized protein LOC143025790 [Oratosquilla oratoria]|uniref:uncharacterized protein LOC143025790 n=1 Tax=Oratosquilla oratoria TaxID=337810 RepID=UPI003F772727